MFEMYMEGHGVDPRARARMMMALVASLVMTTAAGSMSWAAGRLSVGSVGPPQGLDFMQLTLLTDAPVPKTDPPPAPPRPHDASDDAPQSAKATTTHRPRRGDPAPVDDEGPPMEGARASVGDPNGFEGGERGVLDARSSVGCLGVGCLPGAPLHTRPPIGNPTRPKAEVSERAPLSILRARSIYTPDPAAAALAKTKTGLGARAPGRVKVEFCVGTDWRVSSSKVVWRFGGDPEVDRICQSAVKTWRFKPARVGGQAKTTCSDVTFEIQFEG